MQRRTPGKVLIRGRQRRESGGADPFGKFQRFYLLLAAALFILLPGWQQAAAVTTDQAKQPAADEEYVIGIGDVISIQVWREPELSKVQTVRTDGRVSLPLLGDVGAAGESIQALTQTLTTRFSDFIAEPAVTVSLMEGKSKRYYLIGQVQQPGEFAINHPITILQAVARGGGFLEWAKRDRIAVIRKNAGQEKRIHFNYDDFVRGKNLDQNIQVQPGDTIIVP